MSYQRGDIVRRGDNWGVVRHVRYSAPSVDWFEGSLFIPWPDGGDRTHWYESPYMIDNNLSAPFDHTYTGIPDEVLARATFYKLVDVDA